LLAQMGTAQVVGQIRCGQAEDSIDKTHSAEYRTPTAERLSVGIRQSGSTVGELSDYC
jgi:hypothetical protein